MAPTASPNGLMVKARHFLQRLTRFQGPEQEQTVNFAPLSTVVLPSSIKTDKFIFAVQLQFHGRIQVGGTGFTPLRNALANLFQEVRLYGTHLKYGAQVPIRLRGGSIFDLPSLFGKGFSSGIYVGGTRGGSFAGTANTNYDVDVFLQIPLGPSGIPAPEQVLNCLKGPDWNGDLHIAFDCGDGTSLGTTAGNITISAYGSNSGSAQVLVSLIRPVMSTALMNAITPAITFRTYKAIDAILQGSNLVGQKLTDLNTGKKMTRVILKTGTQQTSTSSGVLVYASLSDAIVTRAFPSLDGKPVKSPYNTASSKEYESWLRESAPIVGYNVVDWIESGVIDNAFQAQGLTPSRRWELDGDVTAASNQVGEVIMEEVLGDPVIPQLTT